MTETPVPPAWGTVLRDELAPLRQRPLLWIAVAFILGIVWADLVTPPPLTVAIVCSVGVALTAYAAWRLPRAAGRLALVCVFLLGAATHAWRLAPGAAAQVPPEGVKLARMDGVVAAVVYTDQTWQTVIVNWKDAHDETLDRVYCTGAADRPLHAGDRVALENVDLSRPLPSPVPGERSAVREFAREGIHLHAFADRITWRGTTQAWRGPLDDNMARARERFMALLTQAMPGATPQTYAALLASMVYGMAAAPVPDEIKDLFRRSGTIHLLVASGAQVSIIALTLVFLVRGTRRVLPLWGMIAVAVGLILFAALAGMGVSIWRAVGMAFVMLGSYAWGRRYDLLTALAVTALVLAAWDTAIVFAPGAQLTYACVLGIYCIWPGHRPGQSWAGRLLAGAAWGTLGAWLMATPILVAHFHNMVLIGTLANLVAVPLAAALLYLGLLALALGLVWPPLAIPLCALARVLLDVMLQSNSFFASLPLAMLDHVYWSWPWLLLWYVVVACLLAVVRSEPLRRRLRSTDPRWAVAVTLGAVGAVLLWVAVLQPPANRLRVHVLDVGAGQCVLVEAPAGKILIDAGADPIPGQTEDILTHRVLPYLALRHVRTLDAIVISHAHEDHCNLAAPLLRAIPTRRLLLGPAAGAEAGWLQMEQTARELGVEMAPLGPGSRLRLGAHAWLEVLSPLSGAPAADDPINNGSLVFRLTHYGNAMIFPADIAASGEQRLLQAYPRPGQLQAQVLLAPHHGSGGSCTLPFLRAVAPHDVIVSCASGKRGPPTRTLQRFAELGLQVWRTDVSGVITATSDGGVFTLRGSATAPRR